MVDPMAHEHRFPAHPWAEPVASYAALWFWPGRTPPQFRQFNTDFNVLLLV